MSARPVAQELTLTDSVIALLNAAARGARPEAFVVLQQQGPPQHQKRNFLPVAQAASALLPAQVLGILERDGWPWSVGAGTVASPSAQVQQAAVLSVSKTFHRVAAEGKWVFPRVAILAFEQELENCPVPSNMTIRALPAAQSGRVTAVWFLDAPVPAAQALDLARGLAHVLECAVPAPEATVADLAVPLPGSRAAAWSIGITQCQSMDEKPYKVQEIEAALAAQGRK